MLGPAYLVAVGYMDPGNWATDLAAGSTYGYQLLWIVALSSAMAMLLQSLCCRLGIATGMDLAQACARLLPSPWRLPLWLLAEVAIVACDLAELVGSAIALQMLFRLPLPWGVALTAADTLLLLALQRFGIRRLEALVIALVALIGGCFVVQLLLLQPNWAEVAQGFVPRVATLKNGNQLYLAAGILGATVMPHNLYLHSSLVQTRQWPEGAGSKQQALAFSSLDTAVALSLAFMINASILILAAGRFHDTKLGPVSDLSQAYDLLSPSLGTSLASTLFAVALLASGQSSTLTATMAGQIVMEGFLHIRLPDWQRRHADPQSGPGASPGHGAVAGGSSHQPHACAQPGGAQPAVALRRHPPGAVLQPARADGPAQTSPVVAIGQLGLCGGDRADQCHLGDQPGARPLSGMISNPVATVKLATQAGCALAIGRYPRFSYNANGGGGRAQQGPAMLMVGGPWCLTRPAW